MSDYQKKHPYGTTLLSRDTPENRAKWGDQGAIGYVDVAPSVCTSDGKCPYYRYQNDATREGAYETPIHLLIASFRDRLCPRTLYNAFNRADNPHRIFIRVIEQTLPDSDLIDDAGCWERYCQDYNEDCAEFQNNVKIVHQDASTSKGPTDARSKLSAMIYWDYIHRNDVAKLDFQRVEPEDFCMETDSHMDFSDHYDTELILMHHRTKNDFAVLSTYVADMSQNNQNPATVPNLCMVTFTSTIRNWGTKECIHLVTPKLTNAMWGAGLSFHRCHAELSVPVDAFLSGVFDGEEGSRGLRFFTHGYDVYTPDRVLVTHDYTGHQSNPVVHTWGRNERKLQEDGEKESWPWMDAIEKERPNVRTIGTERVNMMLGIGPDDYSEEDRQEIEQMRKSRFGLGTKRTLEQAIEFSGINLRERKMVRVGFDSSLMAVSSFDEYTHCALFLQEKNKCGNLIWVPFEENPASDYNGLRETLGRGLVREGTGIPPGIVGGGDLESRILTANHLRVAGFLVLGLAFFAMYFDANRGRKGDRHKN